MNKNMIVVKRFNKFAKYLRILSISSIILYLVGVSFNDGSSNMILLCYTLLIITIIASLQSIVLLILAKVYERKN